MIHGKLHVGIGFATGRKGFQNVLGSYIYHLKESAFLAENQIELSLFVAFDPSYSNTTRADYENIRPEIRKHFYSCNFIGPEDIRAESGKLVEDHVITAEEADFCFGSGYSTQRNIILYMALKENTDYIIFLDDDEYPLAVTNTKDYSLWSGQHVIESHIKYLQFADITNGCHCGYLSPLPSMEFDGIMDEIIFKDFINALSSDVLQWDDVRQMIDNGGVTYADKEVLIHHQAQLIQEINHCKFITGGNMGINLTRPEKVLPFYNPPGARGEDSILSTCLTGHTVKKIPAYTFHDGFSIYGTLLDGVLPTNLKKISFSDSNTVIRRFYKACIGWIRYKPLYTLLTCPDGFQEIMDQSKNNLEKALPNICAYFNNYDFQNLLEELNKYEHLAPEHYKQFQRVQELWERIKKTSHLMVVP